jgi:hypothetical protein
MMASVAAEASISAYTACLMSRRSGTDSTISSAPATASAMLPQKVMLPSLRRGAPVSLA